MMMIMKMMMKRRRLVVVVFMPMNSFEEKVARARENENERGGKSPHPPAS